MKLLTKLREKYNKYKKYIKYSDNNKGNTLVELVMVMLLLILFGATIYTLIYTGSETQKKIINQKNAQVEARIALSFINVRLKQNDAEGKISIDKNPLNDTNAIVLLDDSGEKDLYTWIYFSNGTLKEALLYKDEPLTDEEGMFTPIANIKEFDVSRTDKNSVAIKITYEYNNTTQTLENKTYLRSTQQ